MEEVIFERPIVDQSKFVVSMEEVIFVKVVVDQSKFKILVPLIIIVNTVAHSYVVVPLLNIVTIELITVTREKKNKSQKQRYYD